MKKVLFVLMAAATAVGYFGCDRSLEPAGDTVVDENTDLFAMQVFPPSTLDVPTSLVQVPFGAASAEFWPYTGRDFTSNGQDPINLVFVGQCDPLSVRAALKALDGERPGLPPVPPFNCRWVDAVGEEQVAYGTQSGWTGSVIQLECGEHNSIRFHLRLFDVGGWTIGNVHFEVLIPGTSDHEILSWEIAEQFVVYDFIRSGLLDGTAPLVPTGAINPGHVRVIRAPVYNGLPVELRVLIDGPIEDVTEDVPVPTDGQATILNLVGCVPWEAETFVQDFQCIYDQTVPKPFCSDGPYDFVYVSGPVSLLQSTVLTAEGELTRTFHAEGILTVVPIDPMTGNPTGVPMQANVCENHDAWMYGAHSRVSSYIHQIILPASADGAGRLLAQMRVNSAGADGYRRLEQCGDNKPLTSQESGGVTIGRAAR